VALQQAGDDVVHALRVPLAELRPDLERGPLAAAPWTAAPESFEKATGWHSATIVHPPCAMH